MFIVEFKGSGNPNLATLFFVHSQKHFHSISRDWKHRYSHQNHVSMSIRTELHLKTLKMGQKAGFSKKINWKKYFFRKSRKMLLPTHDTVLNLVFRVEILKTATCRSWTDRQSDRQTDRQNYRTWYGYVWRKVTGGRNRHVVLLLWYMSTTCAYMVQIYYQNRFAIACGNRCAIWIRILAKNLGIFH